jgi:cellulose synthase/poly-beta-1,6-N-acetylglucosamine synthase-like glycosyltransferase
MVLIFWLSCASIAYVYVGYSLLLWAWARLRARSLVVAIGDGDQPAVSIVVAARNEGRRLAARIDNLRELAYRGDRQIIVVSDGSTDDTSDVLARYGSTVELIDLPPSGKAVALNAGVARARHDFVVFADARQTFEPDALHELVAPFADPTVGAVTGELVLDCEHPERRGEDRRHGSPPTDVRAERRSGVDRRTIGSTIADGIGLYWRYEKTLRRLESATASTLGATGAIYAMRRRLWQPLPPDTILDDVLAPMRCVLAGYRVVFNDRAIACDRAAADADAEARRKSRTLAGNWQILALEPGLLLPWRNPVWWQYLSHKVGRLLVPYALLALMASSMALADRSIVYAAVLGLQCAIYLLAGYGAWLDHRGRLPVPPPEPVLARGWRVAPSVARSERPGAANA